MRQRGFAQEAVERALLRVGELELQSDEHFAFAYVRSRAARGYGPLRIAQELAQRGVEKQVCLQALAQGELDWFEAARRECQKRFGDLLTEREVQAKAWRFLQYRGFDAEQTKYALKI